METNTLNTLLLVCVITSITPGPSNIIVLAASVYGGISFAIRPYLGVCIGLPLMVFCVSYISVIIGSDIFEKAQYLKYFGIMLILYLSYKIITSSRTSLNCGKRSTASFTKVLLLQWLNPKAWAIVLSTLTIAGHEYYYMPALIYIIVIFPCAGLWLVLGGLLRKNFLGTNKEIWMNRILGGLLASTALFLV